MISTERQSALTSAATPDPLRITLLTGGSDRPYVIGITGCLAAAGVSVDVIGSDELDLPEVHNHPGVSFRNLRGSLRTDVPFVQKMGRVLIYYLRLLHYAATAKPKIFHILWNNKFEHFDRTILMLYYKCFGKKIVLTAHNVNTRKRDSSDTRLNRLTLRAQYALADCIFVHTEKMKDDLTREFGIAPDRVRVIPFGLNDTAPKTSMTPARARRRLGIPGSAKVVLFFGRITPYKGLDTLLQAIKKLLAGNEEYRLLVAGRPDRCQEYWTALRTAMEEDPLVRERLLLKAEFIPEEETELYFKAADVLVLPYRDIYQSGVLFLGYSFGLPVIATDVGAFREDILEGHTGFLCRPSDPDDLARSIATYFESDLYRRSDETRRKIRQYAEARYSWNLVGKATCDVYTDLSASTSSAGRGAFPQ